MVLMLFFPLWTQVDPERLTQVMLTAWNLTVIESDTQRIASQTSTAYIGVFGIIAALLALYSLSQFKDRKRQTMLNMINSLVMVVTLGATVFLSINANEEIGGRDTGAYMMGFYLIVLAMVMNILANRFIRKDELLVRSVDRIR